MAVHAVGHDGGIWSTALAGGKWKNWFSISPETGNVPLRSVVTAISRAPNRVDLFVVGSDGGVYANFWDNKWSTWYAL